MSVRPSAIATRRRGAATLRLVALVSTLFVLALLAGAGSWSPATTAFATDHRDAGLDPQEAALQKLRAASDGPTNVSFRNGFPRAVHTNVAVRGPDSVQRAVHFLRTHKELYGQYMANPFRRVRDDRNRRGISSPDERVRDFYRRLESYQGKPTSTPDLALSLRGTNGPDDEIVAFYQTYKGVEVFGSDLLVFVRGDRVTATVGALLSDLALEVRPTLTDAEAEAAARAAVPREGGEVAPGAEPAPALARTDLVIFDPSLLPTLEFTRSEPHLAWRVTLGGRDPSIAFVDAHSGEVLLSYSEVSEHTDGYELDLEDANGENASDTNCYWDTTADDALGDEDGLNADGQADPQAVLAFDFAKAAYVFYHDTFNRHSYDNDDGEYEIYVHAGVPNASWLGAGTDCDLIQFADGWVAFDVMVHELGHGTLEFGLLGGSKKHGETGALNESFSDVMASLADGNWTNGEGTANGAVRDLSDPTKAPFFDPDRMSEFVVTTADKGGVHTNAGIPNKAAFLLSEGGTHPDTGWTVTGIGKPAMGWLEYVAGLNLVPGSGFLDMRSLMLAFADGAYGPSVVCQVRRAWAAVEVGNGDANCDGFEEAPDADADGVLVPVDNCPFSANPAQKDTDGDGVGDVCDGDADEDGVFDSGSQNPSGLPDNCPGVPNPDQKDANFNGIGEACDPTEDEDFDDDGVENASDNCIVDFNPDQADVDSDGDGDACDPDADGDGWSNDNDNAPFAYNPDQADTDGDGVGDVSDGCPKVADEVTAWTMGIPELGIDPQPVQPDGDGDGTPDACDSDLLVGGRFVGSDNVLKTDGVARGVDADGSPGRHLKVALAPSARPGNRPERFEQHERRALTLDGVDHRVKAWVTDDTGRPVARTRPKTGESRLLRFRPLAGRRYFLFLYFSAPYPARERETFTATMSVETARHRETPPPPPPR